jgi:hypothetical protein
MSIIVVCPGCRKSFKVSDQFAGKSGPCPKCKRTLQVPTKAEEVTVHAPEAFAGGGRTTTGKLITKPIARTDVKAHPVAIALIVAAVLLVLLATWLGGHAGGKPPGIFASTLLSAVGLLLVSLPLVIAAYEVLHDDELEPFRGLSLYIRSAICGLGYVALWWVFSLLVSPSVGLVTGEIWNWVFVVPPFVVLGGFVAIAALNLEFGNAAFHYGFYLVATLLLRWAAGMEWLWLK